MRERRGWDQTFLRIAKDIAVGRSPDPRTQCGCVIANDDNKILGMGYNGYAKGFPDRLMPTDNDKYRWIIHAEANACYNCGCDPAGATAYVTGFPCLSCMLIMVQFGIKRVVYDQNCIPNMCDTRTQTEVKTACSYGGIEFVAVDMVY